jgi:hypothetical protein
MNDAISVDIVDSLCELVKDLPYLVLFYPFIFCLGFSDEVMKGAALAKFHDDINGIIFPVDFEIKISEDMDVVHVDKSVDLIDNVLFLLRRDRRKRHFFYYYGLLAILAPGLEKSTRFPLQDRIAFLHNSNELYFKF